MNSFHMVVVFLSSAAIAYGQPAFTRLTNDPVSSATGSATAAFCDWNRDGWIDLFLGTRNGNGLAYTNSRNGSFIRITTGAIAGVPVPSYGAGWGDIENDGWPDLVVGINSGGNDVLVRNADGAFAFLNGQDFPALGGFANNVAWADYDNDGRLDIFIANSDQNDFLFHNEGGRFARVVGNAIAVEPGNSQGAAWADYDDDGLIDLFVSRVNTASLLYRNLGGGHFLKTTNNVIAQSSGVSQGCTWIDYDNDGRLDLFVANPNNRNWLYHNEGNGQFSRITNTVLTATTAAHMGCAWADIDNDGWLDVFIAVNGGASLMFRNQGNGSFAQITNVRPVTEPGSAFTGAWADIDNDGFQDLVLTHWQNQNAYLYRNEGNSNHWLAVELDGRVSNRPAIGAKVRVAAEIQGRLVWQLRHVSGGDGLGNFNDARLFFGLGNAAEARALIVEWPSGIGQEWQGIASKRFLKLAEPDLMVAPRSLTIVPGTNVAMAVEFRSELPGSAEWLHNGQPLAGETNLTLSITNAQGFHAGEYRLRLNGIDPAVTTLSPPVHVSGPVRFVRQPTTALARPATDARFEAEVTGIGPFGYQWLRDGSPVPNATNSFLVLTNVQLSTEGLYSIAVSNVFGVFTSTNAALRLLIRPVIVMHPVSQSVTAGDRVVFSAAATGGPLPFTFVWRQDNVNVARLEVHSTNCFFALENVRPTAATNRFRINVGVTNIAGTSILSTTAFLTVLPDSDGDGLPDEWELTNSLTSATEDFDADGLSNLDEYRAGTDPTDSGSTLRLRCSGSGDEVMLVFAAQPGKTYAVEASTSPSGPWSPIRLVPAFPGPEEMKILVRQESSGFFRVATPAQ